LASGDTVSLNAVDFPTTSTGYVVGRSGRILKTSNGGTSWVTQVSGTNQHLHSVTFEDENTGYVAGDWGTILKTTNGGASWTAQVSGTSRYLYGLCIADQSTLYAVGSWGTILKSTDGGTAWTTISSGTINENFYSVCFTDPNNGYVTGNGARVRKTTDGGVTWTEHGFSGDVDDICYSAYFTDENNGYAVGIISDPYSSTQHGFIQLTADGALTWDEQFAETPRALHNIVMTVPGESFAVGDYGTILRRMNWGVWVAAQATDKDIRIFPNPATDQVTIEVKRILKDATITLMKVDGRAVMTRNMTGKRTRIDISNLPEGLYLLKLTCRDRILTTRFVKR
jgi:photosystem II stability/assembly factor-like uncharacterized protein